MAFISGQSSTMDLPFVSFKNNEKHTKQTAVMHAHDHMVAGRPQCSMHRGKILSIKNTSELQTTIEIDVARARI